MAATMININTDTELKAKAQAILDDLGLDMTTAINVFLRQVVHRQAIPFEISVPTVKQAKLGGWEGKISNDKLPRSELKGCLKGKVWMADDFDAPLDEMREYME